MGFADTIEGNQQSLNDYSETYHHEQWTVFANTGHGSFLLDLIQNNLMITRNAAF